MYRNVLKYAGHVAWFICCKQTLLDIFKLYRLIYWRNGDHGVTDAM